MVRALKGIALALILGAVLAGAAPSVRDVYQRPVRSVRIAGEFEHVSRDDLRAAIAESLQAGFFAVDVAAVRRVARRLPWVRDVSVQRIWPDALNIAVSERNAVARWNADALLENDASVFRPAEGTKNYAYTQLQGPEGRQAYMLEQYKRLATAFGTVAGGIRTLSLSRQGQWRIEFASGMTLVPGANLDVTALRDFARALPRVVGADTARIERIDLRYANGFAVRWRKPAAAPTEGS